MNEQIKKDREEKPTWTYTLGHVEEYDDRGIIFGRRIGGDICFIIPKDFGINQKLVLTETPTSYFLTLISTDNPTKP